MSASARVRQVLAVRSSSTQDNPQTVKCRHCGFYNSPGRRQCEECGGILAPPPSREHLGDEFSGRTAGEELDGLGVYLHRNEYLPGPPVQSVLNREQQRRQRVAKRRRGRSVQAQS